MEKFYLEEASIKRKEEAIEYVLEFKERNEALAGDSSLDEEYQNYEQWLKNRELQRDPKTNPSERCLCIQYFLIRENDNKIIGMINLRWDLDEWMLKYAGHIGSSIRPSERGNGYSKISIYLCLLEARKLGLDKVLVVANDNNTPSVKGILSLGGTLENKIDNEGNTMGRYWIDVNDSIDKYYDQYKENIKELKKVRK